MESVIGVIGDNTTTEAALINLDGKVLDFKRAGPSGLDVVDYKRSVKCIVTNIYGLLTSLEKGNRITDLVMSLSGIDDQNKRRMREDIANYFALERTLVMDDVQASYVSAFRSEKGILVSWGLRAGVYTYDGDKVISSGGLGHLLDGEASTYWVGAEALRYVVRSRDGRSIPTVLTTTLTKWLNLPNAESIAAWAEDATPEDVGSLAVLVVDAYEAEDKAASMIIERAVRAMVEMAWSVYRRSGFRDPLSVAFQGPMFERSDKIRKEFSEKLKELNMTMEEKTHATAPLLGTCLVALKNAGVTPPPEMVKRLGDDITNERIKSYSKLDRYGAIAKTATTSST